MAVTNTWYQASILFATAIIFSYCTLYCINNMTHVIISGRFSCQKFCCLHSPFSKYCLRICCMGKSDYFIVEACEYVRSFLRCFLSISYFSFFQRVILNTKPGKMIFLLTFWLSFLASMALALIIFLGKLTKRKDTRWKKHDPEVVLFLLFILHS